jgi:hypothetical protein
MYYPGIHLEVLKKNMNDYKQDGQYLGPCLNPGPTNMKQER